MNLGDRHTPHAARAVALLFPALLLPVPVLPAAPAFAQTDPRRSYSDEPLVQDGKFFAGIRGGIGIVPGGDGVAPTGGIELGVSAKRGVGFGLHILGMHNPPEVPQMGIRKTRYGIGVAGDLRFYAQTIPPLTVYPTLSLGFLAGPDKETGKNVILPLINPGFGARVAFGATYVAFEFGFASFFIPFVAFAVGRQFEPAPAPNPDPDQVQDVKPDLPPGAQPGSPPLPSPKFPSGSPSKSPPDLPPKSPSDPPPKLPPDPSPNSPPGSPPRPQLDSPTIASPSTLPGTAPSLPLLPADRFQRQL